MKLILLSSSRLIPKAIELVDKKPSDIKIAHIITASKAHDIVNFGYLERTRAQFDELGVSYDDIDIAGNNEQVLYDMLKNYDIIFVNGGNTFYLLKVVRETGFENVIKKLLDEGKLYVGASAGSYLVCPSIEMALWGEHPKDTYGLSDFSGMNLVPFLMHVHYELTERDLLSRKILESKLPIRILTDEQALLVEDKKITFMGDEKEIILEKKEAYVSYDDFKKLKMQIGTVVKIEPVEGTDKLLRCELDFGDVDAEGNKVSRQIVSGIREFYPEYEQLIGKQLLYVTNLEPREIRGVISNGMLMAVDGIDGTPVFLIPEKPVHPGSAVR